MPGMEQWRLLPATEGCPESTQCQAPQGCCQDMGSVGFEGAQQSSRALATPLSHPRSLQSCSFLPHSDISLKTKP